jgi:Zn-dependent protease
MFRAFPVGRFFGIRLDVHTSWFLLYAFVSWMIANDAPIAAFGTQPALGIGAAAALLLFASVVVHEFAHAAVARLFGVPTRSIELFLFGGVATLECEPPSPRADALVAAAGPALSASLAGVGFLALHFVDRVVPAGGADAAAAILAYAIWVNAVLALFNLIPAFPMDGGRILRALLWKLSGDRDRATAGAAWVGLGLAIVLGAAGGVAACVLRTWEFGWYVVLAVFVLVQCRRQLRALRRPRYTAVARLAAGGASA